MNVSQLKVIWINEKNKQITLKVFFSNSVNCHHLTPYRWQRCLKKSYSIIWNLWSNLKSIDNSVHVHNEVIKIFLQVGYNDW